MKGRIWYPDPTLGSLIEMLRTDVSTPETGGSGFTTNLRMNADKEAFRRQSHMDRPETAHFLKLENGLSSMRRPASVYELLFKCMRCHILVEPPSIVKVVSGCSVIACNCEMQLCRNAWTTSAGMIFILSGQTRRRWLRAYGITVHRLICTCHVASQMKGCAAIRHRCEHRSINAQCQISSNLPIDQPRK